MKSSLALALLLACPAVAQRLVVYDPLATGGPGFLEQTGYSLLLPPGTPPLAVYPDAPPLPVPPPFAVPPGDSTYDAVTAWSWYTNGLVVAAMASPTVPAAAPVPPAMGIPPAIVAVLGGPVTGMAIDAAAGVLYLTSAPGIVVGVTPVPAMPIVVPAFPIPFAFGPVTGLEFDGLSGALYAVSALGWYCSFTPVGVPLVPPTPPVLPLPGPFAGDIALDKTGRLNGVGVRAIYVTSGPLTFDVTNAGFAPLPAGSPMSTGLAFLPVPAAVPPAGVCACATFPALAQFLTGPMRAGNGAFGIALGGLPAGQLTVSVADFGFNPAFPPINAVGCGFGFFFGSPTLNTRLVFANAAGVATYALPLAFVPPGTGPIYYQSITFCPADVGGIVTGIVLSPVLTLSAAGL